MTDLTYIGQELEIFAQAENWKEYFSDQIKPFIGKKVLEVGAGIGASTEKLVLPTCGDWVCLEPDPKLLKAIEDKIELGVLPDFCRPIQGTIEQLPKTEMFDTIIYIDVLEHIEHDRAEIQRTSERLLHGGHLIVLSPAHNFLFSSFDQAIGHYRRYNRKMLQMVTPPELEIVSLKYLDTVGTLTSLANKFILSQSNPTIAQILFWDKWLVPISRILDMLTFHNFGRSILGIWNKPGG